MLYRIMFVLLISLSLEASTEITSGITTIDRGKPGEEILLLLDDGRVARVHQQNRFSQLALKNHKNKVFHFTLDQSGYVTSMKIHESRKVPELTFFNSPDEDYVGTTLKSLTEARKYFREARRKKEKSECFNRAMVWSYEWWKRRNLKSYKQFIFFSRSYIRRYQFHWWFHVAPLVHVKINRKIQERVMDAKYTSGPTTVRAWTNIFMRNNASCKTISSYSEYADFPYSRDCYIQKTHMFTYQPADLQMYEAWGFSKDHFEGNEVRSAYLEAYSLRVRLDNL